MKENDVPFVRADLAAEIAARLLWDAALKLRKREELQLPPGSVDAGEIWGKFHVRQDAALEGVSQVTRVAFTWEIFHAPSPVREVSRKLRFSRLDRRTLTAVMDELNQGIVQTQYGPKGFAFYDEFVQCLAKSLAAQAEEKGFYRVWVDEGVTSLDEKEVDVRIAIRAMDIMFGKEADAICVVSSDQDYLPLHGRIRKGGLKSYHADVAKFGKHENVAHKILDLGEDAILVTLTAHLPFQLVYASGCDAHSLRLTEEERLALWRVQAEMGGIY